jgi:hypothetical protein
VEIVGTKIASRRPRARLLVLLTVAGLGVHCGENGSPSNSVEAKLLLAPVLDVVMVKPGATAPVSFRLTTLDGAPVAGERLDFAAVDAPSSELGGATLSALSGLTDLNGVGSVTVAGGLRTEFRLSAHHRRSGLAEVTVKVGGSLDGTIAVVPGAATGSTAAGAVVSIAVTLFEGMTCSQLPPLALPSKLHRTITVLPGAAAQFSIDSTEDVGLVGQGRDADGHLRTDGCVDVPAGTVVAGDRLLVYLPLFDLEPTPRATFALSSRFSLARREILKRVTSPWQDLGDCPLDPGQLWLDCAIDALGASPGDAMDCVPAGSGEGELAGLIVARRGSASGSPLCRATTVAGAQSLDAKVAALFPNPAQSPASDIDAMGAALGTMFDDVTLGSTLELNATAMRGWFQATHTLRTILFAIGNQSVSVDVVAQGAPDVQARLVPVNTSGDLLTIEAHNLGLHLGTLARTAFAKAALTVAPSPGQPSQSATGDIPQYLGRLFGLASNGSGATKTTGCDALDAVVCADIGQLPGCLRAACVAGQAGLAARLDAAFAELDGSGPDLQLSGSAVMTDADQDGEAEQLGGTTNNPGLWTGQLRVRGGNETIGGSWAGMPP